MISPRSVWAVFQFELRRAVGWSRMIWWVVLALFPVLIVTLIRTNPVDTPRDQWWTIILFMLVPMLVSMLGTFLWTTPAVATELERKSWVYLAIRPHGRTAVLLGKYLAGVVWVMSAAIVGLTISWMSATGEEGWQPWLVNLKLTLLSCPAYAAIYLAIGTVMPKKAMVVAVAYTLIFELVISFVPAVINTLTVQFRLRTLLFEWANIDFEIEGADAGPFGTIAFVGEPPSTKHVLILIAYTVVMLIVALNLVRWSEFSAAAESDM